MRTPYVGRFERVDQYLGPSVVVFRRCHLATVQPLAQFEIAERSVRHFDDDVGDSASACLGEVYDLIRSQQDDDEIIRPSALAISRRASPEL